MFFFFIISIIIIIIIFIIILIEDTFYYHHPLSFFIFVAECQFQKISSSFTPGDFRQVAPRTRRKEFSSISSEDPGEEDASEADKQVFLCPKEGCTRAFQRHSSLERHIAFGTCSKAIERETLLDLAKLKYAAILQEGESSLPTITATSSSATESPVARSEGWALKQAKKAYRFNEEQRQYLEAKFNIGQENGMKVDAETVSKEMRRARASNGERLFRVSEFLTAQQVASFFSRMAAKVRQQTIPEGISADPDIIAMEDEQNFSSAKEAVMTALNVKHPVSYDQYNICSMVKDNTLRKLKLDVLKLLCENLSISMPPDQRKKAPYISLLEDIVKNCSCSLTT